MPFVTIAVGSLLSLLGIGGYVLSDRSSLTALIPLAFGMLLEVCGALALRPALKAHAMHAASVIGLLGILGSAPGAFKTLRLLAGETVARPLAVQVQGIMFVICVIFLALCVRSFRQARARRQAAAGA